MPRRMMHISTCCGASVENRYKMLHVALSPQWDICKECGNPCAVDSWDWDDGFPEPPKPTMKPKFNWYSWLWWLYGWVIYRPYRFLIGKILFIRTGRKTKYGSEQTLYLMLKNWIWNQKPGRALVQYKFKYFVKRITEDVLSGYRCKHCHDYGWNDSDGYFECVDSGRDYDGEYWFHGWTWCRRCRHKEYTHDGW